MRHNNAARGTKYRDTLRIRGAEGDFIRPTKRSFYYLCNRLFTDHFKIILVIRKEKQYLLAFYVNARLHWFRHTLPKNENNLPLFLKIFLPR